MYFQIFYIEITDNSKIVEIYDISDISQIYEISHLSDVIFCKIPL